MKYSIREFNSLTQHEQYDLVFTKGDFVDYYIKKETRFSLYALYTFFVEVEYDVPRNKVVNLIAFNEGKLLDRYWIVTDLKKRN